MEKLSNAKENNITTISVAEISKINSRYIRGVDKWRRMYAGSASSLEKYENGIAYIKVENTEKIMLSNFETAEELVKSWVQFNDELKQAKGWVVYFYRTNASTGFSISFDDLKNKDVIENVIKQMKVEKELQLVNIFSGIF